MSNKSEATWHPNSGLVTDHTDLIARLRRHVARDFYMNDTLIREAAAALADSVPHEQHLRSVEAGVRATTDVAIYRAERDALAHVLDEARRIVGTADLRAFLDESPAVSLARHDAEVKAQALDEQAEALEAEMFGEQVVARIRERAAAIRAEAG